MPIANQSGGILSAENGRGLLMENESDGVYPLATVYCTDEAIAKFRPSDVALLTPEAGTIAAGSDGVFAPGDRWTLSSASVDFEAQGVAEGNLIKIVGGPNRASGSHFAVAFASGNTAVLRRIGMVEGLGQPPAPAAGLTNVQFTVFTLAPQIEQASDEINRRFGIDPLSESRSATWLYDLRDLELATILTVLVRQYDDGSRTGTGDFNRKLATLQKEKSEALGRLQIRWGPKADESPSSSLFTMKLERG